MMVKRKVVYTLAAVVVCVVLFYLVVLKNSRSSSKSGNIELAIDDTSKYLPSPNQSHNAVTDTTRKPSLPVGNDELHKPEKPQTVKTDDSVLTKPSLPVGNDELRTSEKPQTAKKDDSVLTKPSLVGNDELHKPEKPQTAKKDDSVLTNPLPPVGNDELHKPEKPQTAKKDDSVLTNPSLPVGNDELHKPGKPQTVKKDDSVLTKPSQPAASATNDNLPTNVRSPLTDSRRECIIPSVPATGNNRVVVMGGMSHVGMKLALKLHEGGSHVTALEDLLNIDSDPLKWDRWSELVEKKIESSIIACKDKGQLVEVLQKANPSVFVYIPTLFFHPVTTGPGNLTHQSVYGAVVLKEFLRVVITVRKHYRDSRFILVSGYTASAIHQQWLKSLESIFSSYQSLHKEFPSTLVKLPRLFGPWQDMSPQPVSNEHWYIDDVINILQQLVNVNNCSVYSFSSTSVKSKRTKSSVATSQTQQWADVYVAKSNEAKNVTFGAYFVGLNDNYYHRKVMNDHFSYMRKWMTSGHKFGLENIVFHDTLSDGFINRVKETFNKAIFIKVRSLGKLAPNDQRFYFIYDYLLTHRDIGMVITSDVKDVEFLINPALVMKGMGDYFYVGKDVGYILYTDWIQRDFFLRCFNNGGAWHIEEAMRLFGFLNVGVLGGTRASMLASMAHFVYGLNRISTHFCCCDMQVSQYMYHALFFNQLYIGYPFNTAFKMASPGPFGMAVKHKATFDDI